MTAKPSGGGRGKARKLKLKKETLKDLESKKRAGKKVKGGAAMVEYIPPKLYAATANCTITCLYTCYC